MAQMIPESPMDTGSNAEIKIFNALKDNLSDEWHVIHSYRWLKTNPSGRKIQGEGDFVLFNPDFGILVLEVKGGGISYYRGVWSTINKDGIEIKIQDPERQASDTKFEIISRLKTGSIFNCWVWHAVWFPDIDEIKANELPASLNDRIVLTSKDLLDVENALKGAYGFWYDTNSIVINTLSPKDTLVVKNILIKGLKKIKTLKSLSEDINDTYIRLNSEQLTLLDNLEFFKELSIKGRAGTGKTLMAIAKARMEADKEKDVLLLCFNSELAKSLQNNLDDQPYIKVATIHSFALQYLQNYHPARVIGFNSTPDFDYLMEEFIEVTGQRKKPSM